MPLSLDEQELIRRAFHVERKVIRQIQRETCHSRQAIRRAISHNPSLLPLVSSSFRSAPIFRPFQARVEALIGQNALLPRKQRYTAHRIFGIIQSQDYQGCESQVLQHIATWKEEHHPSELFLPLDFELGRDAQVDLLQRSEL